MNVPGYDEMITCPYNKAHQILKSRIQYHLIKCARANPGIQLVKCPFDTTHHIRPEDRTAHMNDCPSRASFDLYMSQVDTASKPTATAPPVQPRPYDDEDESWDHYDVPTYDPQSYATNANVIRQPRGLTPSERRKFNDEERKRRSDLERTTR